jgi:class 3 adenylate cyclase
VLVVEVPASHHDLIRRPLLRYRGSERDRAEDGFVASFDGPARAIRCACSVSEATRDNGLEARIGLHTGECEVVAGRLGGVAVDVAAGIAARAEPGDVLVSATLKDLVAGSEIEFLERGTATLAGIPGERQLFVVEPQSVLTRRPEVAGL